jgi:aldose 1-epimerase
MIQIAHGPFTLIADPAAGGSIAALDWHGLPLLRRQRQPGVLHSGCFPLVPFSNRIAGSRFRWEGQDVALPPNHPDNPAEPAMHGLGWRLPWAVAEQAANRLALTLDVTAGAWPWPFTARQAIVLDDDGAHFSLSLVNNAATAMPAGLGFHPFFPRQPHTRLEARHCGEWQTDAACLPTRLHAHPQPIDWWDGRPVASRAVDTVYTGRAGPLCIHWPEAGIGLAITPDQALPFTTIYVPAGADFFCAEPVSHITDGFNRPGSGIRALAPGAGWTVTMRLAPFSLA